MKSVRARISLLAILLMLTMLTACGGDKYADAREIMKDHADVMEAYITGLEKAGSATECASVIDAYTAGMEDLIPRLKAFREKYPELAAENSDAEIPAEVEKEGQRMKELAARMPAATMNMMKYMADAEVQAAMQRMSQAMEKMGS